MPLLSQSSIDIYSESGKTGSTSSIESIGQILGMLVIFFLILFAAYYVTKFIGKKGGYGSVGRNIRMIETYRLAADKYIAIVEAAGRYFLIGVTKNSIENLAELSKDEIVEIIQSSDSRRKFSDIFKEQLKQRFSKKK